MPRANIDLSWLAGLLSPTPTAANSQNPAYGAIEDPNAEADHSGVPGGNHGAIPGIGYQPQDSNGNPIPTSTIDYPAKSSLKTYHDSNGNAIDPSLVAKFGTTSPYKAPSQWQRMIHPEQSGQIDQLNNSFSSRPLVAQQENNIRYGTALSNIARMPHSALPLGVSPTEAAATGYGTFQTPVELSQQNRAMANMEGGITPLQSSTDINVAKSNLESSNRALQRQPTVEAGLDQQAVNNLQKLLHVDEPSIRLAEMQVKADIGREPTYEEVREQTLKNQLREQKQLIPANTTLSLTQTGNQQDVANKTHELMPYTTGTMANEAVGRLASSRFQPLGEPFGNRVDGPMVTPGARNPLGMSPFQQQMQLMKDFTGQNTQELTLPSGKKVQVQVPTVDRSAFNPLDSGNTITATNMRVPVTHDTSGSMSPGTSPEHSINTLDTVRLPDDIKEEMDSVEAQYYQYPNSEAGMRYKMLKRQYDDIMKKQQSPTVSSRLRPAYRPLGMSNLP